jgi:hypothetical protein
VKRRARPRPQAQNLDSFLDIMTNTVGVLVFVLLFVTLAAADATILVRTPLRAFTEKEPVFFEVVEGRVIHMETEVGSARVQAFMESLPRINWYNYEYVLDRMDGFSTSTGNYVVDFSGGMGVRYRAREGVGESANVVKDTASAYQRVLKGMNPENEYAAFIVRPDGLEAFRAAREVATRRGFASGWEPFTAESEITFGSGGRQVGVQ